MYMTTMSLCTYMTTMCNTMSLCTCLPVSYMPAFLHSPACLTQHRAPGTVSMRQTIPLQKGQGPSYFSWGLIRRQFCVIPMSIFFMIPVDPVKYALWIVIPRLWRMIPNPPDHRDHAYSEAPEGTPRSPKCIYERVINESQEQTLPIFFIFSRIIIVFIFADCNPSESKPTSIY